MKIHSLASESHKTYAVGIGICVVVLIVFALLAAVEPTYAQGNFGLDAAAPGALKNTGSSIPVIIGRVISAALGLVGVVFLILMLYAGLMWMTARGDATKAEKAKDTIMRAVIGIIIIASAYAITSFVISRVTDPDAGPGSSSSSTTPDFGTCVPGKTCTEATVLADCGENGGCFDNVCSCDAI